MPGVLPDANASLARPALAAQLGSLAVALLLCIAHSYAQEMRLGTDGSGGAQLIQAFQALQNITSSSLNYAFLIPVGARVNVSGLYGNPPGSSTWLSGRIDIRGESADLLPFLDLGFISDATVRPVGKGFWSLQDWCATWPEPRGLGPCLHKTLHIPPASFTFGWPSCSLV